MPAVELEIQTPRVAVPLLEPARYKGLHGGRGGGKSHFFGELLIEAHIRNPNMLSVCIREVQRTLDQSVKRLLEAKIVKLGVQSHFDVMDRMIRSRTGSGAIIFEGMQNHNAESIKSLEGFDVAWFAEAQRASQRSLDILRPTIRKPGSELWFDWNPSELTDPVDVLLRGPNPPPRSVVVEMNWSDNPWFPADLREEMEYDRRTDPDKYAHVWLGKYANNSDKRVFKNWRIEEFDSPGGVTFYLGADWGFAQDPTVLVRCYLVGRKLYVDFEAYQVGCEIEDTPSLFMTVPESEKWPMSGDNSRPETISHVRKHGFPKLMPSVKGKGSVEDGVEFLRSCEIIVHPRCRHLADELTLYSYKTDALTGRVLPVLEDRDNHCIAEGQKVRCRRGDIPIENVTEADEVLTTAGFRKVIFSGATGYRRETVIVQTSMGSIKCTPDHRIWTPNGFTRADTLRYNDDILVSEVLPWWSGLSGMAGHIAGTLKASAGRIGSISRQLGLMGLLGCIGMCGRAATDLFRRVSRYITEIKTPGTMRLQTLYACLAASTSKSIHSMTREEKRRRNISIGSGSFLNPGTRAPRESRNIEKSEASLTQGLSLRERSASNAREFSIRVSSGMQTYSAPTLVNRHGEEIRGQTMKQEYARNAAIVSSPTNTRRRRLALGRVQTVRDGGIAERVYDLTVEENHEFFCNGILVSNCIDALRYALEGVRRATHQAKAVAVPVPTASRW